MINTYTANQYCKQDITLIENYYEAISDETQIWDCHHRREIDENKSHQQLKNEGLYYKRPANELIFLTRSEHNKIHNSGKNFADYMTEEAFKIRNKNISDALKGRSRPEETVQKIRNKLKGTHKVWDNKELNIYHFE